jgi:hypothetical protein
MWIVLTKLVKNFKSNILYFPIGLLTDDEGKFPDDLSKTKTNYSSKIWYHFYPGYCC